MKKTKQASPVSDELIDEWLKQGRKPEDINGLSNEFTKRVVERVMQGEMAEHLGYEKRDLIERDASFCMQVGRLAIEESSRGTATS